MVDGQASAPGEGATTGVASGVASGVAAGTAAGARGNHSGLVYGRVQVLDDAIPAGLYRGLLDASQRVGWRFGWNTPSNPGSRYWHHEIGEGRKENTADVSARIDRHPLPVFARYRDWLRDAVVPERTRFLRLYMNAHTFGTDGWPHTDTDRQGELTVIAYLATEWKPEWCGETVVFDERGDISAAVLPRANRLMLFPSHLLHAARPLSKAFEGLRCVLVAKLAPPEDGDWRSPSGRAVRAARGDR